MVGKIVKLLRAALGLKIHLHGQVVSVQVQGIVLLANSRREIYLVALHVTLKDPGLLSSKVIIVFETTSPLDAFPFGV